ncbi:capsule biosynthesis protein [Paracoccus benzoatiresistens]|uniref:Capsule biosynthesis protein n=1 Tax=Paracoccus benzoatiresistens TaxID=2997341 RepID=A0ABT4J3R6_9RHOB|nr:capsule biosynthesis protein [Paracoccus sp. EF6]MCZ0961738.1 capsule biosynthesis protein [Paracoccus sp. EF6]
MTTPPKVRRYHASAAESVRPVGGSEAAALAGRSLSDSSVQISVRKKAPAHVPQDDERARFMRTDPVDDGLSHVRPAEPQPAGPQPSASGDDLDKQLEAIRRENLSERQLRIARRIATLHQIEVGSDEEAVLRLRQRGIDPSHRAALGQILSSEGSRAQARPAANTPAVMPKKQTAPATAPGTEVAPPRPDLPSREVLTEEKRAAEIFRIQRDIAQRRRRRMVLLWLRLAAFVVLPTLLAGWYYFRVATPLYATVSQFRIQSAEGQGSAGAGGLGGLLSGSQLATNTDSVAVQSYLTSRDAMLRLDADKGFKAAYQDPAIDPVKRLPADATNEETFELYQNSVKIGYDPTEGMIDMEVIAPDPQQSQDFSLALIAYAEEQVDRMTSRLRDDQMKGAVAIYEDAEAKVLAAQRRVQELQQTLGVLDPVAEGTVVMNQISALETQLATKRLELGQLLSNPQPLQSRVAALRGDITRLEEMIAETRTQLTGGDDNRSSLALISGELRIAESDLLTRQELLATAAAQMEAARIEANKQVRYLSLSVAPVPPDEATYPKAFQNTLVAFLIFSGIYLMLSLTASILREQVST